MGGAIAAAVISAIVSERASSKAEDRAKRAEGRVEEETTKLKEKQDVSRTQASQKILKARRAGSINPARSTILTQGLDLGGTATGKTLLGE